MTWMPRCICTGALVTERVRFASHWWGSGNATVAPVVQEGRGRRTEARHSVRAVRTKAVVAMLYLVLLAPIGAIALLISMSSLERWQEADSHPVRSTQSDAGRRRHRDAP